MAQPNKGVIDANSKEDFRKQFVNAVKYILKDQVNDLAKQRYEAEVPIDLRAKINKIDNNIESIKRRARDIVKDVNKQLEKEFQKQTKKELNDNAEDLEPLLHRLSDELVKESADIDKGLAGGYQGWKKYIEKIKEYMTVLDQLKKSNKGFKLEEGMFDPSSFVGKGGKKFSKNAQDLLEKTYTRAENELRAQKDYIQKNYKLQAFTKSIETGEVSSDALAAQQEDANKRLKEAYAERDAILQDAYLRYQKLAKKVQTIFDSNQPGYEKVYSQTEPMQGLLSLYDFFGEFKEGTRPEGFDDAMARIDDLMATFRERRQDLYREEHNLKKSDKIPNNAVKELTRDDTLFQNVAGQFDRVNKEIDAASADIAQLEKINSVMEQFFQGRGASNAQVEELAKARAEIEQLRNELDQFKAGGISTEKLVGDAVAETDAIQKVVSVIDAVSAAIRAKTEEFEKERTTVAEVSEAESKDVGRIQTAVEAVTTAVTNKTTAFQNESEKIKAVIDEEIADVERLEKAFKDAGITVVRTEQKDGGKKSTEELERQAKAAAEKVAEQEKAAEAAKKEAEINARQAKAVAAYNALNKDEEKYQRINRVPEADRTAKQREDWAKLEVNRQNNLAIIKDYTDKYGELTDKAKERAEVEKRVIKTLEQEGVLIKQQEAAHQEVVSKKAEEKAAKDREAQAAELEKQRVQLGQDAFKELTDMYNDYYSLKGKQENGIISDKELEKLEHYEKRITELNAVLDTLKDKYDQLSAFQEKYNQAKLNAPIEAEASANKLALEYAKNAITIEKLEAKQRSSDLTADEETKLEALRLSQEQLKLEIKQTGVEAVKAAELISKADADATEYAQKKAAEIERTLSKKYGESIRGKAFNDLDARSIASDYIAKKSGKDLSNLVFGYSDKSGWKSATAQYKELNGQLKELKVSFNETTGAIRIMEKEAKEGPKSIQTLLGDIGKRWSSLVSYLASFASFYQVIGWAKQAAAEVSQLDAQFVELRKVSNDTASELERFRKEAFDIGAQVGSTGDDVLRAAAGWEQLGYNIQDATELTKASLIYQNVADGMDNAQEATSDLVSVLKAFNKPASEAIDVVDALNEVSNNYAVSAADLGDILKRSASTMAVADNSMEEVIAMGTAMQEVLQQSEVAGQTLKMLELRMRSSKAELEEAGESTDGMVESTAKLREEIKQLTGGFDILQEDGKTFKSLYERMKGIAEVWDKMDQTSQSALLEKIAGKNRANGVAALLSNWKQVDNILKTISEDEGSAERENKIRMDSISGRITILKNQAQQLSAALIDEDAYKTGISLVTQFLKVVTDLINKLGALPSLAGTGAFVTGLGKGGGIWGIMQTLMSVQNAPSIYEGFDAESFAKSQLAKQYNRYRKNGDASLDDFFDKSDVSGSSREANVLRELFNNDRAAANTDNVTKALDSLVKKENEAVSIFGRLKGVGVEALGRVKTAALSAATAFAAMLVLETIAKLFDEAANGAERFNRSCSDFQSAFSSESKAIDNYGAEIDRLNEIIHSNKSSFEEVTTARQQLWAIQDQMIDKYGAEVGGIDAITTAVNNQTSALEQLKKAKFESAFSQWRGEQGDDGGFHPIKAFGRGFRQLVDVFSGNGGGRFGHSTAEDELRNSIAEYGGKRDLANGILYEAQQIGNRAILDELHKQMDKVGDVADVRDIRDAITEIQATVQEETRLGKITKDQSEDLLSTLREKYNKATDVISSNLDMYEDLIYFEDVSVNDDLKARYDNLIKLKNDYLHADNAEEQQDIIKQYAEARDEIDQDGGIEAYVKKYFATLIPMMEAEAQKYKLDLKFDQNTNGILDQAKGAVAQIAQETGKSVTTGQLQNWNKGTYSSGANAGYDQLKGIADQYDVSLDSLYEALERLGVVFPDFMGDVESKIGEFGVEAAKSLTDFEIQSLKTTKDLVPKLSVEFHKIRQNFSSDTEAMAAAMKIVARESTEAVGGIKDDISGLDLSGMASDIAKLGDVFDKNGDVKWATVFSKNFKDAFSTLEDSTGQFEGAYDNFLKVISQTPNDTAAVQEAFNNLSSCYIYNSDIMQGLTENNAEFVEGVLSSNGIVNASEVVASALQRQSAESDLTALSAKLLANGYHDIATEGGVASDGMMDMIVSFIREREEAGQDVTELALLVAQKMLVNGTVINTASDCAQLQALGAQANMTAGEIANLVATMSLMSTLNQLGVSDGAKRRYTNVEGKDRDDAIQSKREQNAKLQAADIAKTVAQLRVPAQYNKGASSGGTGGKGSGGDKKEPSKTDKTFDWIDRHNDLWEKKNQALRKNVDNQYVILQDAEKNEKEYDKALAALSKAQDELAELGVNYNTQAFYDAAKKGDVDAIINSDAVVTNVDRSMFAIKEYLDAVKQLEEAQKRGENVDAANEFLASAQKNLTDRGIDYMSDQFKEFIQNVNFEDFNPAEIIAQHAPEAKGAVQKYVDALQALEAAENKTSKTLNENGKGQLSYLEDLIESDKQGIEDAKTYVEMYAKEWEETKDDILEYFDKEKGEKWIKDIENGNINPDEWERVFTYDSNDQKAKDAAEALERGLKAIQNSESWTAKLGEREEQLVEDEQKRYEIMLNVVKARKAEIDSMMEQAQYELDMKEVTGEVVTEGDYRELIDIADQQIENLREQKSVLEDQLDSLDEGEQAYIDTQQAIMECDSAIRDCQKQQAEWNDTILRMPVTNMQRFLGLLDNITADLTNFMEIQEALGKTKTPDQIEKQWQGAYESITDDIGGLQAQQKEWLKLIENNYQMGSTKFSEVDGEVQSCEDSVTSLIQSMIDLNKQLLTIPIEQIQELSENLARVKSGLESVQSENETAINAAADALDEYMEQLRNDQEELEKKYEDLITPLQDQLDLLGKANDERQIQLQLEQAQLALAKAQEQNTVQVIRNGRVQYEQDMDAIRDASDQLADANYDKITHDLQKQIDDYEKIIDDAQKALDNHLDQLDKFSNKWREIATNAQKAADAETAARVFGTDNWREKVITGNDNDIYQKMVADYNNNFKAQQLTQDRLDSYSIMQETMEKLRNDFIAGNITEDEMLKQLNQLRYSLRDGVIRGQEELQNALSLGSFGSLGEALGIADGIREQQLQALIDNVSVAQKRQETIGELTGSWQEFAEKWDEYRKRLREEWKQIDFIGENTRRIADWCDDDDGEYDPSGGVWQDSPAEYVGSVDHISTSTGFNGAYADGLEKGSVGGMTDADKFKAIQAMGLRRLDPDEFPAILHAGEGVINPKQQSTLVGNMRQAMALGANAARASSVYITFGDLTLPNVTNGSDFAAALKQQFTPIMQQYFTKR